MRVGILTFSNALNLGAALQAYSLQKTLEHMGNDAELINYLCPAIESMHKLLPVFKSRISMKTRIYNLIYNFTFFPRRIHFKCFQHSLKKSKAYSRETIGRLNGIYDVFITGSDQVFNLKLTGNDSTYFLDFVQSGKKASYAASLGVYVPEKKKQYQEYLQSFECLSLREKSSAELFKRELGVVADVIPDPVFLHTGEEWKALLGIDEKKGKEKYLLIYSLIETKELYQIANTIAKDRGLKTVVITKALRPLGKADRFVRNAGPREFVELMVNTEYVVTNSFHGTAFSLIFKKQFETVLPPVAQERIVNLLEVLNLNNRIYSAGNPVVDVAIDYSVYSDQINGLKEQGISYLNRILN